MNETMALRPQMRAHLVEVAKRLERVNLDGIDGDAELLALALRRAEKDLVEVRFDRFARVGPVGRVRDFVRELRVDAALRRDRRRRRAGAAEENSGSGRRGGGDSEGGGLEQ